MAQLLANPKAGEILDSVVVGKDEVDLTEIAVRDTPEVIGKRAGDIDLKEKGLVIVGVKDAKGNLELPIEPDRIFGERDFLLAIGKESAISALSRH